LTPENLITRKIFPHILFFKGKRFFIRGSKGPPWGKPLGNLKGKGPPVLKRKKPKPSWEN